jgi:DNA (cytosine-5)-methyltransferase 1
VRYLSVCSGIEAASVAWHGLGWEPVAFAEIEDFPAAVLKHRWPHVPNLGDFTRIEAASAEHPPTREDKKDKKGSEAVYVGAIDLLVGGTPCQSFSVAGLRGGLFDDRGNLALESPGGLAGVHTPFDCSRRSSDERPEPGIGVAHRPLGGSDLHRQHPD